MTTLEAAIAVATGQGKVCEMARGMIGEINLALIIAKGITTGTSIALSPTLVAEIAEITPAGAAKKIANTAVKAIDGARTKTEALRIQPAA